MTPTELMERGGPPGGPPGGLSGAPPSGAADAVGPAAMRPGVEPLLGDGGNLPDDGGDLPDDGGDLPDDDRALLDLAEAAYLQENRARAARLEAVARFHARRQAEVDARPGGFFALTPLQATKVELGPMLGLSELTIQINLDVADGLMTWFPTLWRLCREGRIDIGKAQAAYDQLHHLTNDADKQAYAELVEDYVQSSDDRASTFFPVTRTAFQRAVRRRCLKFPQRDEQDEFGEAFKRRRVTLRTEENGMASLTATTAVHSALTADHRLTMIAKKLREEDGEERTLEQLRADALVELLLGRLKVGASTAELEDDETDERRDPAETFERQDSVGKFARPVINVTVPITTLMGLGDDPGVMAGGATVPADLVRMVAADPTSTWYRLLTDAQGDFVELSTASYEPTAPIFRWVVARDNECVWPGCSRPASTIEIDHRIPFPAGGTCTSNLQPLCRRHHLVKHSEGVQVVHGVDGSYTWTTRFGSTFTTPAPKYPQAMWPPVDTGPLRSSVPLDLDDVVIDEWDEEELGELVDSLDPDFGDEVERALERLFGEGVGGGSANEA